MGSNPNREAICVQTNLGGEAERGRTRIAIIVGRYADVRQASPQKKNYSETHNRVKRVVSLDNLFP